MAVVRRFGGINGLFTHHPIVVVVAAVLLGFLQTALKIGAPVYPFLVSVLDEDAVAFLLPHPPEPFGRIALDRAVLTAERPAAAEVTDLVSLPITVDYYAMGVRVMRVLVVM